MIWKAFDRNVLRKRSKREAVFAAAQGLPLVLGRVRSHVQVTLDSAQGFVEICSSDVVSKRGTM